MDDVIIPVELDDKSKSESCSIAEQDNKFNSESCSTTEQDDKSDSESHESYGNIYTKQPHNGKPITNVEVSPNGKYLVTYSEKDHSIVGWNINDIDEGRLRPDSTVKSGNKRVNQICVSDDRKLAYIYKLNEVNDSKFIGKQ